MLYQNDVVGYRGVKSKENFYCLECGYNGEGERVTKDDLFYQSHSAYEVLCSKCGISLLEFAEKMK